MSKPLAMKTLWVLFLLISAACAQTPAVQIRNDDAVRVREFYRFATLIQDQIWPHWSETPAPLLLVTPDIEFLTRFHDPPKDFAMVGEDLYARPRRFSPGFQATFPAFGPPAVIIVGQPQNTASKTSTAWLIMVMHEHFHQLQYSQPGYYDGTRALGLGSDPDDSMWMLNYPFPYEKPEIAKAFSDLRDLLLKTVAETNEAKFVALARDYVEARKKFFALGSAKDRKYLEFQLWQEGIARYTEIKCAEAASGYQPSEQFAALSDFESLSSYGSQARQKTLDQLRTIEISKSKREVVYSFGATEGLLLDRVHPGWRDEYFQHPFSLEPFFAPRQLPKD